MNASRALGAISLLLLSLRLYAATRVGFGDGEALYVSYALHPQPLYLDHPGLIGALTRLLGQGDVPSPLVTHTVSAALATLVPYVAMLAARLAGADAERAPLAGLALVAVPELAVGLFAMTPDLLLAPLWLLSLGLWAYGLRSAPGSSRALFAFLGAGAACGLAFDAKVTAAVLGLSLALSMLGAPAAGHRRTPAPYLAIAMATLLASPVVAAEVSAGFPMLHHRLVDTQHAAGFSLRNVGALLGGQLAYVSPVLLFAALKLAHALLWTRSDDAVLHLLKATTAATSLALGLLCLWSRVAEPHWFAPALLALPLYLSLAPEGSLSPKLGRWAVGTGLALSLLGHAWALTDLAPRALGRFYEGRYDLANDLFAWRAAAPSISLMLTQAERRLGERPIVLTPHWSVAAQVQATLGSAVLVSTREGSQDDFSRWLPPSTWKNAPLVLWVSDDRFSLEPPAELSSRRVLSIYTVPLRRGGRTVRAVKLTLLALTDDA